VAWAKVWRREKPWLTHSVEGEDPRMRQFSGTWRLASVEVEKWCDEPNHGNHGPEAASYRHSPR
jgi:hypothetical protein